MYCLGRFPELSRMLGSALYTFTIKLKTSWKGNKIASDEDCLEMNIHWKWEDRELFGIHEMTQVRLVRLEWECWKWVVTHFPPLKSNHFCFGTLCIIDHNENYQDCCFNSSSVIGPRLCRSVPQWVEDCSQKTDHGFNILTCQWIKDRGSPARLPSRS